MRDLMRLAGIMRYVASRVAMMHHESLQEQILGYIRINTSQLEALVGEGTLEKSVA